MKYKLVGDFETTTLENDCRVWASCLYDIEEDTVVQLTNNISDFIEFLRVNSKKNTLEIYFHNLKFDGEFILHYIQKELFKYNDTLSQKDSFRTLITDTGLFYQLEIKFYKGKNARRVVIRDSLKIIPLSVEQMAKAFGLKTLKGSIDYELFREKGHQLTGDEINYIVSDCRIVSQCLKSMFDIGLTKMTIASNAMSHYKNMMGGEFLFRKTYPKLDKLDDEYFRKSYKGGYTYASPRYQNRPLNLLGSTYDVNSLYPSVMKTALLPYDYPIKFIGEYKPSTLYPLFIQKIRCKFKLKRGFIPIIQIHGNSRFLKDRDYLKDSGAERVELTLTNVDLEMVKKHYTLTRVEYIDGYMFKGKIGLFDEYIDYWMNVKLQAEKDGNKGLRQIAKLMLNSLYGRFAQSSVNDLKIPQLEDGINKLKSKNDILEEIKDGTDEYDDIELKEDKERELCYTPMASFITAYSRKVTQDSIQDNFKYFAYADTDSIHLTCRDPQNLNIHETNLGAWKHESNWTFAKFIRAKSYIEEINGELEVKCAGMPQRTKKAITKENFKIGFSTEHLSNEFKTLKPKRVPGGIILVPSDFTIK